MSDLDILGLLKRARERAPRVNPHCPPDCDDCSYVIALDAAIKRLERAEIVEGWASEWCGRWTWHGPREPEESRPAVLIVLEADDE